MDEENVAVPRIKRQKKDKNGRFAALRKLKDLKGSKHKYEIDDVDNVYDTVNEQDYAEKVLGRQDDWIIDDNGSGYIEDGRDIFDDDLDSESIAKATKGKGNKRKKKAVSENAGKLSYMLSNMSSKKKEEIKLEDDDLLSELISEIDTSNYGASNSVQKPDIKLKPSSSFSFMEDKKAVRDYMKSFNAVKPKHIPVKLELDSEIVDEEPEVLKEILQNNCNIDEKEEEKIKEKVALAPLKPKLLFKVQPKPAVKEEDESLIENDFDFGEDFDMTEFDPKDPVQKEEMIKGGDENKFGYEITEEQLMEGWETCSSMDQSIELNVDLADVPMSTDAEGESVFRFFWWDAYEDPYIKPGVVLLFGKTFDEKREKFVSCCVTVNNIDRKVYLLPRANNLESGKPVTMIDVYHEFNDRISMEMDLDTFKSKKVTKNYSFDSSVPAESDYLEIKYKATHPKLDTSFEAKTFSHIFGTNSSFLEIFLLERKIKGPCWLNVSSSHVVTNPISFCKIEITCVSPSNISVMQMVKSIAPPPLVVVAINIKTTVNVKQGGNEIVLISCLVNNQYAVDKQSPNVPFQQHFCVFTKPSNSALPLDLQASLKQYKATQVQRLDSERALICYFIAQFRKADPDLVVGHDLSGYQISILCDRLECLKINHYGSLSKVRRAVSTYSSNSTSKLERSVFTGRLVCDIKISAKELIKSRSYDLDTLCKTVLKVPDGKRIDIEPENVPKMFAESSHVLKMITLTMQDAAYILKIMYELNVIPLALQITNIAGNVMSRTLMGGRSERNEFLLLHAFYEKDYIVPEKIYKSRNDKESTSRRKKPDFEGGLVFEPKAGFYDTYILLMDFNSLYPSIIQEYNICFTTIAAGTSEILQDQNLRPGILPTEIRKLVESRREVKKLMKAPDVTDDLRIQYDIRQIALKLTANSMYGCLGFRNSRFYAKELAALVTFKGREILTNTHDLAEKLGYKVIYGDTDSIMINTNCVDYDQVFKIGKIIKQEVNKMYRQVELEIDGVFKYLLLLKKKKYAAVTLSKNKFGELIETQEHKGLDIVRRDWSQIASEAGRFTLDQILSEQTADDRIENIHNHLMKLKDDIEGNKVPLVLYVITKQLTKNPIMYPNKNSLPHVQVALRHNRKGGKLFKAGDTVPYIICKDGTDKPAMQRAYLIEEFKNSDTLTLDTKYYLAQQVHPVVMRICEPLEGTDSYQIANFLGLDSISFKKRPNSTKVAVTEYDNFKRKEVKFRNVKPFTFTCSACKTTNEITPDNYEYAMDKCNNTDCNVRPAEIVSSIMNQLQCHTRDLIKKYYSFNMMCEDPICTNDTSRIPQYFVKKFPICTVCKAGVIYQNVRASDLYMQLTYYLHIFDVSKLKKKGSMDAAMESAYFTIQEKVQGILKNSSYNIIDLSLLFTERNDKMNDKLIDVDDYDDYDDYYYQDY